MIARMHEWSWTRRAVRPSSSVKSPVELRVGRRPARAGRRTRHLVRLMFLAPFFGPFLLIYVVPIGYALFQSMQTVHRVGGVFGQETTRFGGLEQYANVLASSEFRSGLARVVIFGAVQVPLTLLLALMLALLLDSGIARGRRVFQLIYFAPSAVPGVIATIMWGSLLAPGTSPFRQLGLDVDFLGQRLLLPSIGNIGIWLAAGANVIILVSALTAIPREIFDAARIDGAGNLQIAWHIKIPMVRPAVIFALILNIIGALQLFTEPMVFRQLTPYITSGYTPTMLAFNATASNNYSLAAALSVILAVVTFIASFGLLRMLQRSLEE